MWQFLRISELGPGWRWSEPTTPGVGNGWVLRSLATHAIL